MSYHANDRHLLFHGHTLTEPISLQLPIGDRTVIANPIAPSNIQPLGGVDRHHREALSPVGDSIFRLDTTKSARTPRSLPFDAVVTFGLVLLPFAPDVPRTKALVTRVVSCEVAVLNEACSIMAAGDETDHLIITHLDE